MNKYIPYHGDKGKLYHGVRSIFDGKRFDPFFPKDVQKGQTIVKHNNNTTDTIQLMQKQVNIWNEDTAIIAKILKADTLEQTCRNIWDFIFSHFQYKKDHPNYEQVRRPARSWADRLSGVDCDCMSVFAASTLKSLGIKAYFRRAQYAGQSEFSHVYVVVPKTDNYNQNDPNTYWVIDGVVSIFNTELNPIKTKDDMADLAALNGIAPQKINISNSQKKVTNTQIADTKTLINVTADAYLNVAKQELGSDSIVQYRVDSDTFLKFLLFFEREVFKLAKDAVAENIKPTNQINGLDGKFKNWLLKAVAGVAGAAITGFCAGVGSVFGPVGTVVGSMGGAYAGRWAYNLVLGWGGLGGIQDVITNEPFTAYADPNFENWFIINLPKSFASQIIYTGGSPKYILPDFANLNMMDEDKLYSFKGMQIHLYALQMAIGGIAYKRFFKSYEAAIRSNQMTHNTVTNGIGETPSTSDIAVTSFANTATQNALSVATGQSNVKDAFKSILGDTKTISSNFKTGIVNDLTKSLNDVTTNFFKAKGYWLGSVFYTGDIEKKRNELFAATKAKFEAENIVFVPYQFLEELKKPIEAIDKATGSNKADLQTPNMFGWLYGDSFAQTGIPLSNREGGINMMSRLRSMIHNQPLQANSYYFDYNDRPDFLKIKVEWAWAFNKTGAVDTVFLIGDHYFGPAKVISMYNPQWFYQNGQGSYGEIFVKGQPYRSTLDKVTKTGNVNEIRSSNLLIVIPLFDSAQVAKVDKGDYSFIIEKFAKTYKLNTNINNSVKITNATQSTNNSAFAQIRANAIKKASGSQKVETKEVLKPIQNTNTTAVIATVVGVGLGALILNKLMQNPSNNKTKEKQLDGIKTRKTKKRKKSIKVSL